VRGGVRVRRTPLESRLRPHVVGEFDHAEHGWWRPRSSARPLSGITGWRLAWWRLTARRRRTAELGDVVEQLAALVAIGCGLVVAMERVAERGHGTVADDLASVAGWLRDGQPAERALRRWADTAASPGVGRLAATARAATPAGDLAQRLSTLAGALREQAHDERVAAAQRVARLAWAATTLAVVAALATALP
jgi:Flp pilus assembly protein TadB